MTHVGSGTNDPGDGYDPRDRAQLQDQDVILEGREVGNEIEKDLAVSGPLIPEEPPQRGPNKILLGGIGIAVLAAGYVGWDWYRSWEKTYSEQPSRKATVASFDPRRSTIQPSVMLPYQALKDAANKAVDKFAQPASGQIQAACKKIEFGITLFDGCLDVNWSLNASRSGSIDVAKAGDGITVSIPVQFSGQAGVGGDIAKALSLGGKNFSGSFVAGASGKVILDEKFCPKITNPSASFSWNTPASIQIIGKSCVGVGHGLDLCVGPWDLPVGSLLTPLIQAKIAEQVEDINSKIPCEPVRNALDKVWQKQSIALPAQKGMPPMFVNVTPRALASPGIIAEDAGVRLLARLDADVGASTQKGDTGPAGPLPPNRPIADPAGMLSVALPLSADYPTINKVVNDQIKAQLAKKPIVADTPAGAVKVDVDEVEIYPSGDRLAVGAKFKASIPGRIFDAKGTVWLTTNPTPAADGRSLTLADIKLTRAIDNQLWSLLTAALNTQLVQALQEHSKVEFGKEIDEAIAKAKTILADPKQTQGVLVNVKKIEAKLGRVAPTEQALVVEALLDVQADATLPTIPF
ncbi:DUF4403 family protein [Bosea sp. ANAM02]|uniref:DUF4403 family protein n=1 Tax=Bosea sp. ANAM02 TaxID=2020412 RepID=UPI001566841D|nr:DUF4403 family protein [Bosea sp. ANAM02]